jgi:hypothetical protein
MMSNPRRKQVLCPVCSKAFFKSSFPFHVKVCAAKHSGGFESFSCPLCHTHGIKGNELGKHAATCIKGLNSRKQRGDRAINPGGGNPELPEDSGEHVIETRPCGYCQRSFQVDRLGAHEKVCRKLSKTPKRKIFDSSMKRVPSSQDLMGNPHSPGGLPEDRTVVRGNLGFGSNKNAIGSTGRSTGNPKLRKKQGITPKPQQLNFSYVGSNGNARGVRGGFPQYQQGGGLNARKKGGSHHRNNNFRRSFAAQSNSVSYSQQQNKLNIAHSNEPSMANPLKPNFARYARSEQDYYH